MLKDKKNTLIFLAIISMISIFFISHNNSDNITLDEVRLKDNEVSKKQFAVYIKNIGEADYHEYVGDNLFPTGYKLNIGASKCEDINGSNIPTSDVLTQENNRIVVTSSKTVYCTFYFEKSLISSSELASSGSKGIFDSNKGDLKWRYIGTQEDDKNGNINNYLCFGKDTCIDETDDYMYRIIGITADGRIKIQKNKALSSPSYWNSTKNDITWSYSDIFKITLSDFYNNITSDMKSKIENHTWNTGDVKDNSDISGSYGDKIYDQEDNIVNHIGTIGLAYLSDYYFAYKEDGSQNCNSEESYCPSWMIPSNENKSILWSNTSWEWTMTRYGRYNSSTYTAWFIYSNGYVNPANLNSSDNAVRPVFYLKSSSKIKSGSGTKEDPYILESSQETGERLVQEKFNGKIPKGFKTEPIGDLYRFVGACDVSSDINNLDDNKCENKVDNFICFGGDNCKNRLEDNNMYRIIGITSDGKLKLIKSVALLNQKWNEDSKINAKWDNSSPSNLYTNLNDAMFLKSSSGYIPSIWESKISETIWNIGDSNESGIGYTDSGDNVWKWESSMKSLSSAKIGLMYLSDYYYSYDGSGNLDCEDTTTGKNDYKTCRTSWIYIKNSGISSQLNINEWTMSRYGYVVGDYLAWGIGGNSGASNTWNLSVANAIRPVFYLKSDVTISSGTGGLNDPFIIN